MDNNKPGVFKSQLIPGKLIERRRKNTDIPGREFMLRFAHSFGFYREGFEAGYNMQGCLAYKKWDAASQQWILAWHTPLVAMGRRLQEVITPSVDMYQWILRALETQPELVSGLGPDTDMMDFFAMRAEQKKETVGPVIHMPFEEFERGQK